MTVRAVAAIAGELIIERVFDAPRDLVFKAWTEPERAARWWGPEGFVILSCEMDVRPGGLWRRRMRSPEGTLYCKRGVYREILAPERLSFTYTDEDCEGNCGPETLVSLTFTGIGGKTRLILHQAVFATEAQRESHRAGWTGSLDRLAGYLPQARHEAPVEC
jgi:uncharacterized protein YndB with AHSA1/START domain